MVDGLLQELLESHALFIFLGLIVTAAVVRLQQSKDRRRLRFITTLVVLHVILVLITGLSRGQSVHPGLQLVHRLLGSAAVIGMLMIVVFAALSAVLKQEVLPIFRDLIGGVAWVLAFLYFAGEAGINVSGLVATSAVLTAVVGLSVQDTLGNMMAGLAIQADNSLGVDDWIKVDGVVGRVVEMRWRYTAIETRNWETQIIPNSKLVKGEVMVLGRRQNCPVQWRRWIWFNVDFRHSPAEVIQVVTESLNAAKIPNVASDPAPNCLLMSFEESYGRYAARYWLTNLHHDDPTDSAVRTRIYVALKRVNIPLSIPAEAVFLTREDKRRARKAESAHSRRVRVLEQIPFFAALTDEERAELANRMTDAPFVAGEVMTRQGADAHWLYLISSGRASIHVRVEGASTEVAQIGPGQFFGEMSLLTGEPRKASVIAQTDVLCYRLDKGAFQRMLERRPELAEHFASILAARSSELDSARAELGESLAQQEQDAYKTHMVMKIRRFFALDPD